MLSLAQNTFHHNPRLRGPVSSVFKGDISLSLSCIIYIFSGSNTIEPRHEISNNVIFWDE